jgi:CheY-like chemotaxis protein
MDRMLPGNIDGLAILDALRKADTHTPILILSAPGDVDEQIRGLRRAHQAAAVPEQPRTGPDPDPDPGAARHDIEITA